MTITSTSTPTRVRLYPPHGKVVEGREEYVVQLDVPEFMSAEMDVCVDGDVVTVTGDRQEAGDGEPVRFAEHLEESFRIPADCRAEELWTTFDDGTCEIHIPRHRFGVNADATPC